MSFTSKAEVCNKFSIDPSLDTAQIIKELTQLQAEIHPDRKPDYSDADQERFTLLEEAKSFLRENPEQTLVPISQIVEIIKLVKSEEIVPKKESEVIAEKISRTSETILRTIKQHYLPRKITVTSISAIITLLWAFPSVLAEHPIMGQFIDFQNDEFSSFAFTIFWLYSLIVLAAVWLFTYRTEQYTKNVLHDLENADTQFSLFSDFVESTTGRLTRFTSKDLEIYLLNCIKNHDKQYLRRNKLPKYTLAQVTEIIPQISEMIITRATEKGIITKLPDAGWYDTYTVN